MKNQQGCLAGLTELFLLDKLFDWLQKRFGFGKGLFVLRHRVRLYPAHHLHHRRLWHRHRHRLDELLLIMRWLWAAWAVLALLVPQSVAAQSEQTIRISAPASGDVLQGLVDITGTSAVDGFLSSELSFAYASDATNTWFLIYRTDQPVTEGLLAAWDTNLVTDGDYDLRLRVSLQDGSLIETLVTGLRIRNQTPTETPTPEPTLTPKPFDTPLPTPLPPTPNRLRRQRAHPRQRRFLPTRWQ